MATGCAMTHESSGCVAGGWFARPPGGISPRRFWDDSHLRASAWFGHAGAAPDLGCLGAVHAACWRLPCETIGSARGWMIVGDLPYPLHVPSLIDNNELLPGRCRAS